jgi:NitT/TauT family transport system substrate-binding protein
MIGTVPFHPRQLSIAFEFTMKTIKSSNRRWLPTIRFSGAASRIGGWLCCGVMILAGCAADSTKSGSNHAAAKVNIALNWIPDAQHGGFYAAQVHGFYEAEGVDVAILPGGPNAPVVQQVATKRADFGIGDAEQILLGRRQGADIVAVLAVMRNSPRCIMVHADSPIRRLDQLRDVSLAVGAGKAFVEYMKAKLPLERVTIVPYTGSIALFMNDKNLAQQAYVFSEPLTAKENGVDVRCLMVSDLGFNPYCVCLFAHGDTIRDRPELVRKVARATRRGWQRYLDSPDETNRTIHAENPAISLRSLQSGAEAIRELCLPGGAPAEELGQMSADRWRAMADQLAELGFVEPGMDIDAAFSTKFLE